MTPNQLTQIEEKLLDCRSIKDKQSRHKIVQHLPSYFGNSISASDKLSAHMDAILDICKFKLICWDFLLYAIYCLEGKTRQLENLCNILQEVKPQSITWTEVLELKIILRNINIPDDEIYAIYPQIFDNLSEKCKELAKGEMFRCLLSHLAKRPHSFSNTPLLTFLEKFDDQMEEELKAELSNWKNAINFRLCCEENSRLQEQVRHLDLENSNLKEAQKRLQKLDSVINQFRKDIDVRKDEISSHDSKLLEEFFDTCRQIIKENQNGPTPSVEQCKKNASIWAEKMKQYENSDKS